MIRETGNLVRWTPMRTRGLMKEARGEKKKGGKNNERKRNVNTRSLYQIRSVFCPQNEGLPMGV